MPPTKQERLDILRKIMIHNKDKTPYEQRAPVEVCMLDWWLEMPARRDYLRILENEFHVNWRYQ